MFGPGRPDLGKAAGDSRTWRSGQACNLADRPALGRAFRVLES
jgi:hypothetical protein